MDNEKELDEEFLTETVPRNRNVSILRSISHGRSHSVSSFNSHRSEITQIREMQHEMEVGIIKKNYYRQ